MNTQNLTSKSFGNVFNTKGRALPVLAKQAIKKANFKYNKVDGKKYDEAILKVIKTLDSQALKISGPDRLHDWEKGWEENLQAFKRSKYDLNQLIPKFVKKGTYIRFQGNFIEPQSDSFETNLVTVIRYYLYDKYYKNLDTLYEFGAGTGLNLIAASEMFPEMKLVGLDWTNSSIKIINSIKKRLNINISGERFDLFNPDKNYRLDKNSAILTIGTLEQLGSNFKPFIKYLLKNRPKICIHIETIFELYDENELLDYLAIKYLEQRNYLKGLLTYLEKLENEKRIKILEVRKTFGSFYHDGYTYIIWKPI